MEAIEQKNETQDDLIDESLVVELESTEPLIDNTAEALESTSNQTLNITVSDVQIVA